MLKPNHLFLLGLIATCCAIEFMLTLADLGAIAPGDLRRMAYDNGAFWPGLLGNWKPNYASQPYLMFVSYSFLHGGLTHLVVNMISLWSLGRAVGDRAGQFGLLSLYVGTSFSGAATFALLTQGPQPMVGASGSLFGLMGALLAWEYHERQTNREGLWDVGRVVLLLIGLNLVLWWAMDGQLAWQTHLGGGLGGWIGAHLLGHKPAGHR